MIISVFKIHKYAAVCKTEDLPKNHTKTEKRVAALNKVTHNFWKEVIRTKHGLG
jgi:hypothetical protein